MEVRLGGVDHRIRGESPQPIVGSSWAVLPFNLLAAELPGSMTGPEDTSAGRYLEEIAPFNIQDDSFEEEIRIGPHGPLEPSIVAFSIHQEFGQDFILLQ